MLNLKSLSKLSPLIFSSILCPLAAAQNESSHACSQAQRLAPVIKSIQAELPAIIESLDSPTFDGCRNSTVSNDPQGGCPPSTLREYKELSESLPYLEEALSNLQRTYLSYTNRCKNPQEKHLQELQLVSEVFFR